MATEQKKAVGLDFAKNPISTTYLENGTAIAPLGYTGELNNLPQSAEGTAPILYNEDGSVFTLPVDSDKKVLEMKANITGLSIAISKGNDKVKAIDEMIAEADNEDKPVFEKNKNSQLIAIKSNTDAKAAAEVALETFRLSLVTPSQRATERRLAQAIKERDTLIEEIKLLENTKKAWNVAGATAKAPAAPTSSTSITPDVAKANREKLISENGTQGKAIIALVKEGWKNHEIASHMGIPPASVPGPKNAWKESPDGIAFIAANPGKVQ